MSRRLALRIIIGMLLTGGTVAGYFLLFDTYHFAVVEKDVLYRDGMQGMRRFRNAYRLHPFKSVINLQSDDDLAGKYREQVAEEQRFCSEHAIKWTHIPMQQETPPSPDQIAELLRLAGDPANQPALMHDSQGVIRVGMMVAAWQMEKMGFDPERALREIINWGHPTNEALVEFIKTYKKISGPSSRN